jgi:hypothetical protein
MLQIKKQKMRAINYIFFSAVLLFSLVACKKGATGPTGPKGLTGPNGVNTQYEVIDTVIHSVDWSASSQSNFYNSITISDYNLSNSGGSLVYVYVSTANNLTATYYPLPTFLPGGGNMTFDYNPYSIYLIYNGPASPVTDFYVKIVVVPQP